MNINSRVILIPSLNAADTFQALRKLERFGDITLNNVHLLGQVEVFSGFLDDEEIEGKERNEIITVVSAAHKQLLQSINLDESQVHTMAYHCWLREVGEPIADTAWHSDGVQLPSFYYWVFSGQNTGHFEIAEGEIPIDFLPEDAQDDSFLVPTNEAIFCGQARIYPVPFGDICYVPWTTIHRAGPCLERGYRHTFHITSKSDYALAAT